MSLNVAREPQAKRVRHRHRFEPQWGPEGAELSKFNSKGIEPVGYLDKMSAEERNKLAKGRLRFRAGGVKWVGGKTWHVEAVRRGLDADRRAIPEDDRLSRRPVTRFNVEPGEVYNPSLEALDDNPMYQDGKDGRYNGRFARTYQGGEASPVMTLVFEPHIPTLRDRGLVSSN